MTDFIGKLIYGAIWLALSVTCLVVAAPLIVIEKTGKWLFGNSAHF